MRLRQLWTSGYRDRDTSVLELVDWSPPPGFQPMTVSASRGLNGLTRRIYVMGHPEGGDLSLSLHGSRYRRHTLDPDEADPLQDVRIHYTSPTAPGSSGSATFEEARWEAVGLHRGTITGVAAPDGSHYDAREAVWLASVAERLAQRMPGRGEG